MYSSYLGSLENHIPVDVNSFLCRLPYFERLIKSHFPSDLNLKILDIGCGYGAFIFALRQFGYRNVWGVDISQQQVDTAIRLGIVGIERKDIFSALQESDDASYDCVIAFDVLEHHSKSELIVLVDEIYRVLRNGGVLISHVPNAESPFGARIRYADFTHETAFTCSSIGQLFNASGFKNTSCFEDEPVVHGVKSFIRYVIWNIFKAVIRMFILAENGSCKRYIASQNLLAVAKK